MDIELKVKRKIQTGQQISAREAKGLLKRLDKYRKRLKVNGDKANREINALKKSAYTEKQLNAWVAKVFDPEGIGISNAIAKKEFKFLLDEIVRRKGVSIATRLVYGKTVPPKLANESLETIQATMDELNRCKDIWYERVKQNNWAPE